MAARIPENVATFMKSYLVGEDEIWPVPGGKSFAIKHSALERIASERKIKFAEPTIVEAKGSEAVATIVVRATMGAEETWAFGEASPKNNKNAYPFAMAEKRAKDRCILKLLNSHGAIYSEDEADDFKHREATPAPAPAPARDTADDHAKRVAAPYIEQIGKAADVEALTAWATINREALAKLPNVARDLVKEAWSQQRTRLSQVGYAEAAE